MKTSNIFFIVLLNCFQQLIAVNYVNGYVGKSSEEIVELLVEAIKASTISKPSNSYKNLIKQFSETFDDQMIASIFDEAITEIISTSELSRLPDILWSIYLPNNKQLFAIMMRAQLQLYHSYDGQKDHPEKDKYLPLFANKLYKIQQEDFYKTADDNLRSQIEHIINRLPNNLKYLLFEHHFCLLNIEHSSFMYTGVKAKETGKSVWIWSNDTSLQNDAGFIQAEVKEKYEYNKNILNVVLQSTKYQTYYYMVPETKKIAGWDSSDAPLNYIWNIKFIDDDRVVLFQDDYLMCAAEKADSQRRNVAGHNRGDIPDFENPECQWRLGECSAS